MNELVPLEIHECKALKQWARLHKNINPYLIHIPNEGRRTPVEGRNLKLAGLTAGVSDFFFALPAFPYHGLWIEMKRRGKFYKPPTQSQKQWLALMAKNGYQIAVSKGWEDARDIILRYLGERE